MLIPFDYLFEKYKVKCTGLLHCGGSYAQERDMYEKLKIPKVLWVEAIPDVFQQMANILMPYANQIPIRACVSDKDNETVTFNISNNEKQSSSFLNLKHHAIIHPEVKYVDRFETQTVRLDTLFGKMNMLIKDVNFINFDLQGVELKALNGMGELLDQIDYCYLEVNKKETYEGCALIYEIDEFLKDFERVETAQWVADTWTDAFYVRKNVLNVR